MEFQKLFIECGKLIFNKRGRYTPQQIELCKEEIFKGHFFEYQCASYMLKKYKAKAKAEAEIAKCFTQNKIDTVTQPKARL